jgi:preprotein translocase subunit SecG
MFSVMLILLIIVAVLLIIVVLLQPGKGDMLAGLGGGLTNNLTSMFGSRKTMDLLMKITIGFAITILVLTIITNKFFVGQGQNTPKPLIEGVELPSSTPPAGGIPQLPQNPQQNDQKK